MTDTAAAMADTSALHPFEGKDVLRTTIAVTSAGDGLSEALAIDPQELHQGDRVFLVMEGVVEKVRFEPIKDTQALTRVHIIKAGTATLVDGDLVRAQLDAQAERIEEARAKAKGLEKLTPPDGSELGTIPANATGKVEPGDFTEDDPAQVAQRAHDAGLHAESEGGLNADCPACQEELAAVDAELATVEAELADPPPADPPPADEVGTRRRRRRVTAGS